MPVNEREYDACYYEIVMSEAITEATISNMTANANGGQLRLYLELISAKNISVYVYIGRSRNSAYDNGTDENEKAKEGKIFSIGIEKGFMVVAVPEMYKYETELHFNYWVEAEDQTIVME